MVPEYLEREKATKTSWPPDESFGGSKAIIPHSHGQWINGLATSWDGEGRVAGGQRGERKDAVERGVGVGVGVGGGSEAEPARHPGAGEGAGQYRQVGGQHATGSLQPWWGPRILAPGGPTWRKIYSKNLGCTKTRGNSPLAAGGGGGAATNPSPPFQPFV